MTNEIKELLKIDPGFTYEIDRDENGRLYHYDKLTGYMVSTRMTIKGITREMWMPVIDNGDVTTADISNAIERCLIRNIKMFGLINTKEEPKHEYKPQYYSSYKGNQKNEPAEMPVETTAPRFIGDEQQKRRTKKTAPDIGTQTSPITFEEIDEALEEYLPFA